MYMFSVRLCGCNKLWKEGSGLLNIYFLKGGGVAQQGIHPDQPIEQHVPSMASQAFILSHLTA